MHIVDELITERAPKLVAKPRLFKLIRPWLYKALSYDAAVDMADTIAPLSGREAFKLMTRRINPAVQIKGLENLPAAGRCVIIANHPTGLADGMAVFKAIQDKRPEHIYLANADALRVMPHCEDIIIPVEWVKTKRSHQKARQTLISTRNALKAETCVVIFPSGVLATLTWRGIKDKAWQNSAAMMAKKYDAPIIPLRIKARNSWFYYLLSKISGELRDITLFYELLNKKNQNFEMTFGAPILPDDVPQNAEEATAMIRGIVEAL